MALMDPYGLNLMSVESWGLVLAITSLAFIVGGIQVVMQDHDGALLRRQASKRPTMASRSATPLVKSPSIAGSISIARVWLDQPRNRLAST